MGPKEEPKNRTFYMRIVIIGLQDVAHARQMLPNTKLITVHMDAVNHMSVYRKDLRQFVQANKLENVAIPEDGETVKF